MKIVKYSLALAFLGGFFVAPVYANSAAVSLFSAFERKVFSLPSVLPPSNFVLTSNIEGQITKQITKQVLEGASQSNNAVILPVTGFLNAPWQQRMFLEYETLSLRHTKLQQMLERWEAGTLEATPRSPIKLLQYQSNLMAEYLRILEKRAEIEKIPLVYENLKNLNEVKPQIDQLIQQKKQAKEAFIKTFDPNSLYTPWQQRMVWEYHEVSSQHAKLQQMLEKWEKGKLEETPRSPFELLEYQKEIMDEYLRVLKIRAGMEQFSLSSH